jgi:long-chain acyl-CoA synthetase
MYHLLARRGDPANMNSVRFFVSGGACLPQPVAQAFIERYHRPVLEGYGLTEASPVVSVLPPRHIKYLSVGPALPGIQVKVLSEDHTVCEPGVVGELYVKGVNVMKGYWHKPEETENVLSAGGWLRTGDLAYLDDENYIYIVDRVKDLIIMNGENIYPGEVESCLYEMNEISECAVIGHPDPLRGQAIWAYVVMKDGFDFNEDKIRRYLMKNLAAYKIPRRFIPMDALPKNPTGKILKRVLRND